jgi:hypothetical protein
LVDGKPHRRSLTAGASATRGGLDEGAAAAMKASRIVLSTFAAFVVSQVLAGVIHGFILAADYAPYYGSLLRSTDSDSWQVLLLPISHFAFICGLMWVYARMQLRGSAITQGLKLGFLAWLMGQVPLWLVWYAEQPWPGSLVVKQLGLELVSSIAIGLTIVFTARQQRATRSDVRMSPAEDTAAAKVASR